MQRAGEEGSDKVDTCWIKKSEWKENGKVKETERIEKRVEQIELINREVGRIDREKNHRKENSRITDGREERKRKTVITKGIAYIIWKELRRE